LKHCPLIIGHRGAAGLAAENSLRAFQAAIESGADGVELDVHLTSDKVPIVLHDATLGRVTSGHGAVAQHSFAAIKGFSLAGCDDAIPSLDDVLGLLAPTTLIVNVEIKINLQEKPHEGIEVLVAQSLIDAGMLNRAVISSFDWERISAFLNIARPALALGLLEGRGVKTNAEIAASLKKALETGFNGICFPAKYLPKETLTDEQRGKIWIYNADNARALSRALAARPAAIITDRPDLAINLRDEIAPG
jgi:glycerophosphoryl diester phosphodiesterase